MKVGIKLGKVKKFGIGWCIPHRVVADNAKARAQSPTGYQKRTAQILRATHFYDLLI